MSGFFFLSLGAWSYGSDRGLVGLLSMTFGAGERVFVRCGWLLLSVDLTGIDNTALLFSSVSTFATFGPGNQNKKSLGLCHSE